nr:probable 4-coumarate--CoA ligase 1 [Aedes albopictus]
MYDKASVISSDVKIVYRTFSQSETLEQFLFKRLSVQTCRQLPFRKTIMSQYESANRTWSGPIHPSIFNPEANIGQVVLNILSRTPAKIIQINADTGYEMTCAEMKQRIVRIALHLKSLGYRLGDLATLACNNTDNLVPVYFACVTLGIAVNPLAPVFKRDDLAHMMRLTQSKVVFCDEANRVEVEEAAKEAIRVKPRIYVMGERKGDALSVDELLAPVEGEDSFVPPYLGDSKKLTATVLCSSGTTGLPKGVCLSHAHLIAGELFSDALNAGPIFNFSPLFWMTGVFAAHTSILYTRSRIITTKPFSADTFFSIIERYQVEDIFTPPSTISAIQSHPSYRTVQMSSVKRWLIGGSTVAPEMVTSLRERFSTIDVKAIYGCSEYGCVTSPMLPNGSLAKNMTVKITNENGRRLGPNEKGEICLQYNFKFLGYINNKEMTLNAFDGEGFYKTGDIGYFDAEGRLHVVDRIKDIIKYMNFQISPSDLEDIVLKIRGVAQVCVAGIPTEDRSSELATAMIVKQPGSSLSAQEVEDTVNGQVSDYKKLRGGVFFVDQLPMTPAGKVLRRSVRDMIISGQH